MELRLIRRIAMLRSHGTGAAGATAVISAVASFCTVEMGDAGRDIISGWRKGIYRTGGQARLFGAAFACADDAKRTS